MASNCLAPGYVKIFYSSNGHSHTQTLPVKPASVVSNFHLLTKDGTNVAIADALEAYYAVWAGFFATGDTMDGFEQYTQANCASAPVFQGAGTLTGFIGASGSADVQWGQADFTFKSAGGGRGLLKLLETPLPVDTKSALNSYVSGTIRDFVDYLIGDSSWILARDNTYLSRPINLVTKTNDALRKKFLAP